MRLAVGITTRSASRPPETRTKRSRMWRSFSLFSAPPIGTIQPRVAPSGTLLGISESTPGRLVRAGYQRGTVHCREVQARNPMPKLPELFANNRRWAAATEARHPGFFGELTAQQSPRYLWI